MVESGKSMWYGEYLHTLDNKDRFILPAKYRQRIKAEKIKKFFLTRGLEECVFMFAPNDWDNFVEKFKQQPFTKQQTRFFNRLIFSGAYEVDIDSQGRILMPTILKGFASIKKDILIAGIADRIEIWDRSKWNQFYDKNRGKFEEMAENIFE